MPTDLGRDAKVVVYGTLPAAGTGSAVVILSTHRREEHHLSEDVKLILSPTPLFEIAPLYTLDSLRS